mgnify:CR=1 FL=1
MFAIHSTLKNPGNYLEYPHMKILIIFLREIFLCFLNMLNMKMQAENAKKKLILL